MKSFAAVLLALAVAAPVGSSFAQAPMSTLAAIETTHEGPSAVFAADIDGDGDLDVLGSAADGHDVTWWENDDVAGPGTGAGGSWTTHLVDGSFTGARAVHAADVDGDGDLDVLAAAQVADEVSWWENGDLAGPGTGNGGSWTKHVVDGAFDGARSVYAADVDGDGDLDVVGAAQVADEVTWWENDDVAGPGTGDGGSWTEHVVDASFNGAWAVRAADMDGDGDVDVLGAASGANDVTWWENDDVSGPGTGDGASWTEHLVDGAFSGARSVHAADVDGDGDLDVLAAANFAHDVTWWENADVSGPGTGDGSSWTEHLVDGSFQGARSVHAADVDGDGDLDVLGAAYVSHEVAWWENGDVSGPGTGDGSSWTEHLVGSSFYGAQAVHGADLDGDGDVDVLGAAFTKDDVTFWANDDVSGPGTGDGGSWTEQLVDGSFRGASSVQAADMDGDGDLDVLASSALGHRVAWWENDDASGPGTGDGSAWTEHSVAPSFVGARSVHAADVDGDGDLDALGAGYGADAVRWWENEDVTGPGTGDGGMWTEHVVDGAFNGAWSVHGADVDGDGDLDVLGAAYGADDITWWENDDVAGPGTGDGGSWTAHVIDGAFDGASSVRAADIDGDGDLDVLATARLADEVIWWENDDVSGPGTGDGGSWTEHVVDGSYNGAESVHAADVDGDGDLDVVAAALVSGDVTWWENDDLSGPGTGDGGSWSEHVVDAQFSGASSVHTADVDGDGDLDVLGAASNADDVTWWENDDVTGPGTGDGGSWTEHVVDGAFLEATAVHSADMDGDGDSDVLGASYGDGVVGWWTNLNDPPTAATGGPWTVDEAAVLALSDASTDDGTIVAWLWDFGDGSTSTTQNPTHAYADDGTFTVALTVTDDFSISASATTTVTVANVPPTITSTPAGAATENSAWTYSPTATDPAGTADPLNWSLDAGAPAAMTVDGSTGALAWTPVYADVGSLPVTLTVDDGDGGADSQTITIVVAFQDDDGDGMPDTWETAQGLDPTTDDAALDGDGDGLSNLDEFLGGTDPAAYDGPSAPAAAAPLAGSEVDTPTPELSWTSATDPQNDTLTYDVEVYEGAALTNLLAAAGDVAEDGSGTTSWIVDVALPENVDVTWRVRAADPHTPGPWSGPQEVFVNAVNEPPADVVASAPLEGDRVDTLVPTFAWSESSDGDRDDWTYDVRVWNEAADLVVRQVTGVPSGLPNASWTVAAALAEDTFYAWQARAVDEHGLASPWSDAQGFLVDTDNAAPGDVAWIAPADGAQVEAQSPTLRATESMDEERDTITYEIDLDSVPTYDSGAGYSAAVAHGGSGEVVLELSAEGVELDENTTWWARIRAVDATGAASAWAEIAFFVRGPNDAPSVPGLRSPEDGLVIASTADLPAFVVAHATDAEGDRLTYDFAVAADPEMTELVFLVSDIAAGGGPLGDDGHASLDAPFAIEAGTWYWSARATDDRGAESGWAAASSFTIDAAPVVDDEDDDEDQTVACAYERSLAGGAPSAAFLAAVFLLAMRRRPPGGSGMDAADGPSLTWACR